MKTKSLSLLIALALCITVGGVYAAWIYAENDLVAVHGHIGSFGLSNAVINNSKGTITVDANAAKLIIDQKAANDYTGVLKAEGTITVTFVPSETFKNQHPDATTYDMQYYLVTTGNPDTFKADDGNGEKLLFTAFDTTTKDTITLEKDGSGNFVGTIDASVLLDLIAINNFELNTYEKYQTFSQQIGTFGNIGVEVAEVA